MKKDKPTEVEPTPVLWRCSDHDARHVTYDTLVLAFTEAEAIALIDEKLRSVGCKTSDEYPYTLTKVENGIVTFTG